MANLTISLKAARVNANKKPKEAADHIGVTERTLLNYEKGRTVPDHLTFVKLAEFYGLSTDQIFFDYKTALSGKSGDE